MTLKGNKGEWSELYAFFKLLADGRLYCGDGELNRYEEKYYPILEIFRDDSVDRMAYKIQTAKNNILVSGQMTDIEIPVKNLKDTAESLLAHIKEMKGIAQFSDFDPLLKSLHISSVKAKSSDKADIRIIIHNLNNGTKPELGYSIKSKLGADSTLINPNKDNTNFVYRVEGITLDQKDRFNEIKRFKDKFDYLKSLHASVTFCNTANATLHNNLTLLDLGIERIIAESLLLYYSGCGKDVTQIVSRISLDDPLHIAVDTCQPMYSYKMKQFLIAFALGMTSSKPWCGKFNANGGYIVVKEDGDIVCYHFFDRNDLEDYLYYNTRFETPSTTRHEFGDIYEKDGCFFVKLNLQIRFK